MWPFDINKKKRQAIADQKDFAEAVKRFLAYKKLFVSWTSVSDEEGRYMQSKETWNIIDLYKCPYNLSLEYKVFGSIEYPFRNESNQLQSLDWFYRIEGHYITDKKTTFSLEDGRFEFKKDGIVVMLASYDK